MFEQNSLTIQRCISKKIKKATTDSHKNLTENLSDRAEMKNLINIYAAMQNITLEKACKELHDENCQSFKDKLTESLIANITPISNKIAELMQDLTYIKKIITTGKEQAANIANENLKEIRKIVKED